VHSLNVIVYGLSERVVRTDGGSARRTILNLTLGFDRDVIDGGPAARFANTLVGLPRDPASVDRALEE